MLLYRNNIGWYIDDNDSELQTVVDNCAERILYEMVVLLNYRKICKLLSEIPHRICMMMMADNDNIKLSKYPQTAFLGALFWFLKLLTNVHLLTTIAMLIWATYYLPQ